LPPSGMKRKSVRSITLDDRNLSSTRGRAASVFTCNAT
jgi:hypothetical protein